MVGEPYRTDHRLIDHARARIVKAAASVGLPAIAEMTLNYPTKDKSEADQKAALDECKRDAEYARSFGFRGKWTGILAQAEVARDVFTFVTEGAATGDGTFAVSGVVPRVVGEFAARGVKVDPNIFKRVGRA